MKIIRFKDLKFVPASHEDPKDPGVLKKVLLKKDELINGRVQMINWSYLPKGKSFAVHFHEDMDEIFILMSGKVRLLVDKEEVVMEKGDCVVAPMKKFHQMFNIGKVDVEYIVVGISLGKNGKTVVVS